jgi:hypothetical protein
MMGNQAAGPLIVKKTLVIAAVIEAATGLALLIVPSLLGQLLFGAELTAIAVIPMRVAGIVLVSLAVACWPGTPLVGMLTYSAIVTLYLAYAGFIGGFAGILLWPVVVVHVALTALLARALKATHRGKSSEINWVPRI